MKQMDIGNHNVLVIVVTYNAASYIRQCLSSIDIDAFDVLVVDNNSKDNTIQIIKNEFPKVIISAQLINLGFGQANNIGLQKAITEDYDYVLLLNQDAWVKPDTLSKLIESSRSNPAFWILSPIQYHSGINDIEPQFKKYLNRYNIKLQKKSVQEMLFANAAVWLISRNCIHKVGGFDPIFPHYGEDDDYINRVYAKGGKLGIVTSAVAYHDRNLNSAPSDFKRIVYLTKLSYLNKLKKQNGKFSSNIIRMLSYSALKFFRALGKGNIRLASARLIAGIKAISQIREVYFHREMSKNDMAFLK